MNQIIVYPKSWNFEKFRIFLMQRNAFLGKRTAAIFSVIVDCAKHWVQFQKCMATAVTRILIDEYWNQFFFFLTVSMIFRNESNRLIPEDQWLNIVVMYKWIPYEIKIVQYDFDMLL